MKKIKTDVLSLCFPSRLAHAYTHKAFFRLKSRTTLSLERYQLVSFRKKDAKIGIGKGDVRLTLLWLRTSLFLGQAWLRLSSTCALVSRFSERVKFTKSLSFLFYDTSQPYLPFHSSCHLLLSLSRLGSRRLEKKSLYFLFFEGRPALPKVYPTLFIECSNPALPLVINPTFESEGSLT